MFLCEENPLFLRDVLKYKQAVLSFETSSSKEDTASYDDELSKQFMCIWSTYVSSNGHLSVNVSCETRAEINPKEYKEKDLQRKMSIFDECYFEIQDMLMQNLCHMLSTPKKKGLLDEDGPPFHRMVSNNDKSLIISSSSNISALSKKYSSEERKT
mmetsp:Transcript_17147/g.22639  ORF Transcript_17147/g.22639 Transcript_17147/m.22639 type:complete len:156 (+) Transcript_17147:305-772(+)